MKKIVVDNSEDGLESLLGENVMVFSLNYIYAGVLSGIDEDCLKLDGACIVYETGKLDKSGFQDAQALARSAYVQRRCVEMVTVQP